MVGMSAAMVTVQADTRGETESLLARVCAALDLEPLAAGKAYEVPGRGGRWMARAQPAQESSEPSGR
jgi:hypothetical protein